MLEQEKAVQFRFDSSEKNLSERLAEIGLPDYARVFSCIGLPNLFGWQNVEHTESFQETWLFLPDDKIEQVLAASRSFGNTSQQESLKSQSFKIDDKIVYPVCSAGKIICIIAVPESKALSISEDDLEKLIQLQKSTTQSEKADTVQIAYEFVTRLFDCKQSYSVFSQRLLTFLTDQVDKSYAGLYWRNSDDYHRRWAYGDLKLSDKLTLNIPAGKIERWKEANLKGKTFIPAELVNIDPVFVQSPPSFLFVYQTPNFGDREQWLVLAVPGDISSAAIARINIIASLLCSINDDRMTGFVETVDMFLQMLGDDHKVLPVEEALKLCFKLLDHKLRMSSMCLLDTDNSCVSCLKSDDGQITVEKNHMKEVPDFVWKVIETNQPMFHEGPLHHSSKPKAEAEGGKSSHAFFPIPLSDNSSAMLSAEFTSEIHRAQHFEQLFQISARYLGICLSLSRGGTGAPKVVGTPNSEIADTLAFARLKTLGKLNDGYFHELIEHLSVILGQAEIIEYDLQHSRKPVSVSHLLSSNDRIVRAAISLADGLSKLKEVSTITTLDEGKSLSADTFLKLLPTITYGYSLNVKDNKNVEISLQTKIDRSVSFVLPVLHIYDIILPLILAIMDESLCSGRIFVTVTEHFGRPAIRISYSKKMLGKLTSDKLADKVFKYHKASKADDNGVYVAIDGARMLFSEIEGDSGQAIYTLTNHHQPIDE